jgi:probable FeS assembly SUF system protein SufT
MHTDDRILVRDVDATIVPYGDQVTIPEGTRVNITHRLGGNFTVTWSSGMARILAKDADALGETVEAPAATQANTHHEGPPDTEAIWDALKQVFDPEIPVNIVDLGLVYSLKIVPSEVTPVHYTVHVDMTLTAPGCGMGPAIAEDAKYKVLGVAGVTEAIVEIVWDPPWTQDMITEEGKMELGLI